jgi:hypothetical protein
MSQIIVKTDRKWKQFVYGGDVPKRVLAAQFDYLDDAESQDGFFKYKNTWHHTSEFMRVPNEGQLAGWDGIMNWSYSNGALIKLSSDGEEYQIGYYYVSGS